MNVETNEPAAMSKRDKWLALLPFLVFGVASILGKVGGFWQFITWVAANLFVVIGLVIGGLRGFPRWTYSYLGWTGVFSFLFQWSIFPLLVALGLILLLRRSFRPLRELARGIWNDWTLLSLTIYCLFAYVMLIYDENHHPYLILFMLASTAVVCGTIWQFMSSRSTAWRVFSLAAGFIAAFLIGWVCDNTWDWRGYYGFADVPREMWYESLATNLKIIAIWSAMLFWPAIIALAHRPVKPPPPARA